MAELMSNAITGGSGRGVQRETVRPRQRRGALPWLFHVAVKGTS